jgi:hypothetical protein
MKSDGSWFCRKCRKLAKVAHDKPECHTCADWSGCQRDCTASAVSCSDCGTSIEL